MTQRKSAINIMIWTASPGGMRSVVEAYLRDGFLEQQNIKLIASYESGGFFYRQLILASALGRYAWTLLTRRVGLVHCHAAMRGSFWRKSVFAIIARALGVPILLHLHGSEMKSFYVRQPNWVQRLISLQLERASRILVLSEGWKEFVLSIAPRSRPVVVPNYVTIPQPFTKSHHPEVNLLFLGLIGPRKGAFDLLKAFAGVRALCPQLRLTIGGNGEIEEATRMAKNLGITNVVTFTGWVDGHAKTALLEAADIFVLPSYNEGLPVGVLEAMAYGLPIIATPVGAIHEVVTDNVHGRLIKPGDIKALENAILTLAKDPASRKQMGRAGYERVCIEYSEAVVLPILSGIYADVMHESAPSKPTRDLDRKSTEGRGGV